MLRKIVTLISIGLVATASAEKSEKLDQIQKSLDKIVAKAGISFDGVAKSQFLTSEITGEGANDTTDRQIEGNEFTSVDFDIKARPNEMISGRVNFRMYQNWQNFFSDVGNPIFTRWISIDANVKDMVSFHVGDFKEKYSPLTLSSPDIDILNEPFIFARQRQVAMDELFLGDNYRVLQGLNLKLDAEVAPIFNEFHLGLIGSRLRNIETGIKNGSKVTQEIQKSSMAKYFVGANLDLTFLKGINLGGTYLYIFDQKNSYKPLNPTIIDIPDTLAQRTSVISLRPGIDITKLLSVDAITLKLSTEFAFSNDDSTRFDSVGVDSANKVIKDFSSIAIKGSAINIGGEVGISPSDKWGIKLDGSFIMNSKDFRNELAQSPSFIGERILNNENKSLNDTLYNTFDALYHNVFKYAAKDLSNAWDRAPFAKNAYRRMIYTQNDLATFQANDEYDPALQLVMPFGPATPNRVGINANVTGNILSNGVVANVVFASLKDVEVTDTIKDFPKTEYSQIGGGLKVDLSKMIPVFKYPFELSTSYVLSSAKGAMSGTIDKIETTSGFLNVGLNYQFFKRASLLGGYQSIANKITTDTTEAKLGMGNWAVGIEWKVSDGASVVFTYGQMSVDNQEYTVPLPNDEVRTINNDISQDVIDLSMIIKF